MVDVWLRELEVLKLPICAKEPLGVPDKEIDFNTGCSTCSLLKDVFSALCVGEGLGALGPDLLPFRCAGLP